MILILDISRPFQPKLGAAKTDMGDALGWRVWWLWFALTYSPLNDREYFERCKNPDIIWTNQP